MKATFGGGAATGSGAAGTWRLRRFSGSVGELHALPLPERAQREVWEMRPSGVAVVLGSSQRSDLLNPAALEGGLEVVKRRSGGGVVMLRPGHLLWVDVILPKDDALLLPDVGRSFEWLGRTWQEALAACGIESELHSGGSKPGAWGNLICFAGLNHGELTIGGAKVLGLSQRRSLACARFQSALLCKWQPEEILGVLQLDDSERDKLRAELHSGIRAAPVKAEHALREFLKALPTG